MERQVASRPGIKAEGQSRHRQERGRHSHSSQGASGGTRAQHSTVQNPRRHRTPEVHGDGIRAVNSTAGPTGHTWGSGSMKGRTHRAEVRGVLSGCSGGCRQARDRPTPGGGAHAFDIHGRIPEGEKGGNENRGISGNFPEWQEARGQGGRTHCLGAGQ